jgi:ubiquitin
MGKTACKEKDFEEAKEPKYVCKKCGAKVKKEKQACKPRKI